ncbi:MAG: hypothetical protein WAW41_15040 [Methylobacter sp.]
MINWVTEKAQQFLPAQDTELDEHELSIGFDFALSAEIMELQYASQQAKAAPTTRFALDEHELALA